MTFTHEIMKAIRATLIFWVITAIAYSLFALGIGQIFFPYQANGSLIKNTQGQIVGSVLIGQPFTSEKYFHSRPSTINYSTANPQHDPQEILKTGVSGASNFAPSNPDLLKRIKDDLINLKSVNDPVNADLIYTSGSGLDPHITIETARGQIDRIVRARKLTKSQVESLVEQNTDQRFLGIFGEPGVRVLQLNLALDNLKK